MHNDIDIFRLECGFEMIKPAPCSTSEHLAEFWSPVVFVVVGLVQMNLTRYKSLQENSKAAIRNNIACKTLENEVTEVNRLEEGNREC